MTVGGLVSRHVKTQKEAMCIPHLKVIVAFLEECMLRTRSDDKCYCSLYTLGISRGSCTARAQLSVVEKMSV